MKQLFDYLPILAFFGVYLFADIYYATAALMAAAALQVVVFKLLSWPIPGKVWLVFAAVMVFGTLTLVFRNPLFIQWRPSVVNWVLALLLVGSRFVGHRQYVQRALGKALVLPDRAWRALIWGWAGTFALSGAINLWVAYTFSESTWVYYKIASGIAVSFLLVGGSVVYLAATRQLPSLPGERESEASSKPAPIAPSTRNP